MSFPGGLGVGGGGWWVWVSRNNMVFGFLGVLLVLHYLAACIPWREDKGSHTLAFSPTSQCDQLFLPRSYTRSL